ncbi:hypothetical protein [Vibrio fortis]|uniref:hypothetical protein n=1 Tax=Vibrio fortis TaxID=212667 RepID=UPI0038CD3B77
MPIELVAVLATAGLGLFAYFLNRLISNNDERHRDTEAKLDEVKSQQRVDDMKWEQQKEVNTKVQQNSENIAVQANRIDNVDKSIDELKDQLKTMDGKLDQLLTR